MPKTLCMLARQPFMSHCLGKLLCLSEGGNEPCALNQYALLCPWLVLCAQCSNLLQESPTASSGLWQLRTQPQRLEGGAIIRKGIMPCSLTTCTSTTFSLHPLEAREKKTPILQDGWGHAAAQPWVPQTLKQK